MKQALHNCSTLKEEKMTDKEAKQLLAENKRLTAENDSLKRKIEELKDQFIRLMNHNLDLRERLEEDVELRRRAEVARELMNGNIQRQRNADLQDDAQLMAIIELKLEENHAHLDPDFDAAALAEMLGVSRVRLDSLFRHQSMYHTPEAYLNNLRTLNAMRLLKEKPEYSIAAIAEESGLRTIRTLQRRMQDVIGMTPVEFRLLFTRDKR